VPRQGIKTTRPADTVATDDDVELEVEVKYRPLSLVWAKTQSYPFFPAEVIDHVGDRAEISQDVLSAQPSIAEDEEKGRSWLVRFFDTGNSYAWVRADRLDPLGVVSAIDEAHLRGKGRKGGKGFKTAHLKKMCQEAYRKAMSQMDSEQEGDE